jgi:excisionase family DNA binding protein
MASELLSIKEVAERLSMSEAQLRELARTGKLPATKQAGRWLVQATDLEGFRPVRRLSGATKRRARLSEGLAVDDMARRLMHKGTAVTPRAPRTAKLPPTMKERARVAQTKEIELMKERLEKPHPPERSI